MLQAAPRLFGEVNEIASVYAGSRLASGMSLKTQITPGGDVLAREYVDDGYRAPALISPARASRCAAHISLGEPLRSGVRGRQCGAGYGASWSEAQEGEIH